jgi:hypothetical protein
MSKHLDALDRIFGEADNLIADYQKPPEPDDSLFVSYSTFVQIVRLSREELAQRYPGEWNSISTRIPINE